MRIFHIVYHIYLILTVLGVPKSVLYNSRNKIGEYKSQKNFEKMH